MSKPSTNSIIPWLLVTLLAALSAILFATRDRGGEAEFKSPAEHRPSPSAITRSGSDEVSREANKPKHSKQAAAILALAESDPEAALNRIEAELEGAERATALRAGLRAWLQKDPEAASEWLLAMRGDPQYESALAGFVIDWAKFAPSDAAHWVGTLPVDEAAELAADAVATEWAKTDALAAYDWALEHYSQTESSIAFQRALAALARLDPAAALAALHSAPSDLQFQGHSQLAAVWARSDLNSAADWAARLPDGREKSAAVGNIVAAWSQTSPSAAATYLGETGDFDGRENAAATLAGNWAMSDSVRASEWLASLPVGSLRDHAIVGFGLSVGLSDPAAALTWTMDIGDAALREAHVGALLFDWHEREPVEAKRWLEANPDVPADLKEVLLRS